jgi:hypothetical protein
MTKSSGASARPEAGPGPATAPVQLFGIPGIPEISPGDDLAALIASAGARPTRGGTCST